MYLINLMEDLVSKLADSYLKEKNIPVDSNMRMDIIVYTLNRIAPRYVTSARGFLHIMAENEDSQINADIFSVISDACDVVKRRSENILLDALPKISTDGYYLVYPSILGNLFYTETFFKVNEALIYVYSKNNLLEGYGSNFPNPAIISSNVPGKFMLCFAPVLIEDNVVRDVTFDIVIECGGEEISRSSFVFNVSPSFYRKNDIPLFHVEEIDDIMI